MPNSFIRAQSVQNNNPRPRTHRTALSLFIGGVFCSAAPAWADCVNEGTNTNGGLNITCEGAGSAFNNSMANSSRSNNVITVQGNGTTISSLLSAIWINETQPEDVVVSNNSVILNNDSAVQGWVTGGYLGQQNDNYVIDNNMSVIGNSVTLNDNSTAQEVTGGYFRNNGTISNYQASGNRVTLNDEASVTGDIKGYQDYVNSLAKGDSVLVTDNSVTLNDNSIAYGSVYGVQSENNSVVADGEQNYQNNSVTLNGNSRVENNVYAVSISGYNTAPKKNINVINNSVSINDTATVAGSLYGGFIQNTSSPVSYDVFSGNTLNFAAAPIALSGEMANFENYNFTVDPALVNTDTALITANTITFGTNETNMKGGDANTSKIKVVGIKAGNELLADDKFVLMQATGTMSGNAEGLTTNGVAQQGISLLYDVRTDVDIDGKLVTATIIGKEKPVDPVEPPIDPEKPVVPPVEPGKPAARVNPQLKALSEGHLASAMMLTRGADTLAYNTVHTIQHQNPQKGLAPFITLSGGKTRYNSGSHIDAKDGLLTGGLGYQTDKLTSAVLIESGWGSYTTHNGFNTMNNVNGDGHSRYVGGAVIGHYDFDSGIYAEASLRAGKNRNTFDTKDIVNLSTGEKAHYNLDSSYLGAHIGTGYAKALDEKNTADVSAKYLWTQLKGKGVKVAGDNIHFDDINSHRIRLDAGLSHKYTEAVAVRAGLGYEYEFDGKANASTYGYGIGAPSVQGSTAILTLGSTVKPLATQPLSVDINLNGYTGKRDGVGGSVKFNYAF
ncbi:outer membrane autotransporter barrel domain protein [Providencia rettgeri DSM 1131]|uniref:autotransporter outer membrane beta-barrel domain-containing protein n=1 Tax=Providencia rettgeri TaxID=587 RepID=UPI000197C819|nr:autotransporter outer membrane beta-barrel domain-containing protein [Providencia rettgeri]EFE51761.1 outer membrane autotransporter barrel domain protein [Providencia rettgeri DSM 1131]QXA58875.1 autotransporter outer membrane beta-barrel domain-containing protein [Providencia rettgeri]